jgi:UDP-3-O-[3-hydroxymyristoyl] glucosamine N-acyltransferase LpxD
MDRISLSSIIKILAGQKFEIKGKKEAFFSKFCPIEKGEFESLTFCKYSGGKGMELICNSKASIIVCPLNIDFEEKNDKTYILVENPRLVFARIVSEISKKEQKCVIHKSAIIGRNCNIGKASIGEYAVIGDNVSIGDGSVILAHAVVGDNTTIGEKSLIKSNAVIGQKGFGFEYGQGHIPVAIPHIGTVKIGNNVEIGANTVIVRATLGATIISDDVKIDDLVFIAHNVEIGARTLVIACAEISGSVKIGVDCWLGPNCSIMNQIIIGNNVLVGLGAVVLHSVPDDLVVAGNPAKILRKNEK